MYGFAAAAGGAGALLSAVGLAWLVVPLPFAAVLGYQGWHARTLHNFRARAFSHLDVGDYSSAAAVYDELAHKRNVHYKLAGLIGLATVSMRRGDAERARALLSELRRHPQRVPAAWIDLAAEYLAMEAAAAGDVPAAEAHLADSDVLTPLTATAYATVAARAGAFEDAASLGRPPLRRRDARLFSHELRVLHLMRAFALHHIEAPADDDRALARPAFDAEYDYLTATWPALSDYLSKHPLPAIAVADDATLPRATLLR